ncbi:MAG: hypothetical protein ACRDWH_02225 [Acidimicrobiia bacterium]
MHYQNPGGHYQRPRGVDDLEHESVVVTPSGGNPVAMVLVGILVLVAVVFGVWFFASGTISESEAPTTTLVDPVTPAAG